MKILRLDLLAYGPFTNSSLDFGVAGSPLHIVFGPNEAGKSSCLRAMRAWLYSVPSQNSDNFLHQYSSMRIGGSIEGTNGERLEFIRRKGNSKTIRAPDDVRLIEDSELNRFLGGVDQTTFEQRFAIDYQELQRGGEQIAKGTGQLAEILFAAGAGITHLREVQKGFDDQLQKLFKPRGTLGTINIALSHWKESRSLIKQLSLATADWEKHRESLQNAQRSADQLAAQLEDARIHHHRYDRLAKAFPILLKLDLAQQSLSNVANAPVLPPDFSERRTQAFLGLSDAEHRLRESQQEISRLKKLIQEIALPTKLLARRSEVDALHSELGGYQKAAKDRPRLTEKFRSLQRQAEKYLSAIGWEQDIEKARTFQLTLSQRSAIGRLASEWTALVTLREQLSKSEIRLRKSIGKLEADLANQPEPLSTDELKRVHRRASREANAQLEWQQLQKRCQEIAKTRKLAFSRLPLFQGTMEQLLELAIPLRETMERFEKSWRACDEKVVKLNDRIGELSNRYRLIDRKIEKLRLEQDVPTELDLQQARNSREAGWQLIRRLLTGDMSESDRSAIRQYLDEWPNYVDLSQAFHASIQRADLIADRLRRESLRVSEKSTWTSECQELMGLIELEKKQLEHAYSEKLAIQQHWHESWSPSGIDPLSPEEMLAWLQLRDDLVEMYREESRLRDESKALEDKIVDLFHEMRNVFSTLSYRELKAGVSLVEAIELCDIVLKDLDLANQQILLRNGELAKLREDLSEVVDAIQHSEEKLRLWMEEWRVATEWLCQSADLRPDESQEVLREIDQLTAILNEMEDTNRRMEGIDRDMKAYVEKGQPLVNESLPGCELPIDQAVIDLHLRLQEALAKQSRTEEWHEQLLLHQSKLELAQADKDRWQTEIQSLCGLACDCTPDDLPSVEQKSKARLQYEMEVQTHQASLLELAGSETYGDFLEATRASDLDQITAEFQRLGEQISNLDQAKKAADQEVGARQSELKRMDGSARAAQAHEETEHHLAAIRSGTENYIRLRLADLLLRRSIERFRESHQGPILSRASQLFAKLTLGSFSGLRADFDEQGKAVLLGVRGDTVTAVPISGMSTGTCDQLYLALRLAMIESHTRDHHPMPLIVDDVLIQFDDDRSVAALKLLSELAETTQVIYFTHHQRIVELADQHLPPDRWVEHRMA